MRPIGHRLDFHIQTHMFVVADDADNLGRHVRIFHIDRDSLPKWILSWQMLADERLVNDDYMALFCCLLGSKEATPLQRNLHYVEIIRIGHADASRQLLTWR